MSTSKAQEFRRTDSNALRSPNLSTIIMVEEFLREHQDIPLRISAVRQGLPKKVMHSTLKTILEYLWESGKILYGPKGIQWIYNPPEHVKALLDDATEV